MSNVAQIAKREIEDLQAEGIQPTFKEMVWLNDLGKKVEEPRARVDYALAGVPVKCGNVTLWPCSIASGTWFDDTACVLFKTELMQNYCLAYAMANARNPDIDWEALASYHDARKAVNSWVLRCRCTSHELKAAVDRIAPQLFAPHPVEAIKQDPNAMPIDVVTDLVAGTGLPVEYWESKTRGLAERCWCAVMKQQAEGRIDSEAYDKMVYQEAMHQFMLAAAAIRKDRSNG